MAVVNTYSPTNAGYYSMNLNGTLEDLQGNSSLDVYFEYGPDDSYGNTTAVQTLDSIPTIFSAEITDPFMVGDIVSFTTPLTFRTGDIVSFTTPTT